MPEIPVVGLKFKEQLPAGPIRDEFEQFAAAVQTGFSQLSSQIESGVVTVTNFIVSVQEVEVTLAASTATGSANFTIPIDVRYAQFILLGMRTDDAGGAHGYAHAYISAVTETSVTCTRDAAGPGPYLKMRYMVVQYRASALRSAVQIGTITLTSVTSATATIQSVGPKYALSTTGWSSSTTTQESDAEATAQFTDAQTLTGKRDSSNGTAHVGYCIVDFN